MLASKVAQQGTQVQHCDDHQPPMVLRAQRSLLLLRTLKLLKEVQSSNKGGWAPRHQPRMPYMLLFYFSVRGVVAPVRPSEARAVKLSKLG